MRIGALASESGVSTKTIRFWEASGLVPEPARTTSGYRDYGHDALGRLVFIRNAQASGLTLDQIRQILEISDGGDAPCEHVTQLIDERLVEVEARLADLSATKSALKTLASRAAAQDPTDCSGYCSIIPSSPVRAQS